MNFFGRFAAVLALASPASAYDLINPQPPLDTQAAKPTAVAATRQRTFVLDGKKGSLFIFDLAGGLLKTVPGFSAPGGIAAAPDGGVFVADTGNSRVQGFDSEGELKATFGTKGAGPGNLSKPRSVAVGLDGRVYVADTGNDRVQVFTGEGVFLFSFGGKGKEAGKFKEPSRVAVDAADNVYVLDEGNERLQKFNAQTKFIKEFPLFGQDFDLDEYGFLYMLDSKRGKVSEVGPNGVLLGSFGTSGSGSGQFKKPSGIAVHPDGSVLVADTGNTRIQRVIIENKLKTELVAGNLATKLLVKGPTRVVNLPAASLAARGDTLYAYLPKAGQFVSIDLEGKETARFGKKSGKDPSVTAGAKGFAVSEKHGLYVADTAGDKVQIFDHAGVFKQNFGESKGLFASKKKEGRLSDPAAVAVNEKGTIYVADAGNRRISAFQPDGNFLFGFGPRIGAYELKDPAALAWDEEGFLFVLDRGLKKVIKCQPSGAFVLAWGEEGEGVGRFKDPAALAYDGRSYLYVLDRKIPRVSVFDKKGKWVTDFFAGGQGERDLGEPAALTVQNDELVIADPSRNRIAAFALRPLLAPPAQVSTKSVEGVVHLDWTSSEDPWVKRYRVYRASSGAAVEIAQAKASNYKDGKVDPEQTYFYQVAVEAQTGDIGPFSRREEVFVPGSVNRAAIEISTAALGNIFPARYKWYLKNPLGTVKLANNVDIPYRNVKLAFRLKDFMDFATETQIETLDAKESVELPLVATLNNKILEVSEDTPIQAELSVTYFEEGKEVVVSKALPLKVYSRNAITWEDAERIASFVTPNDPPVLDLGRQIQRMDSKWPAGSEYLNENLKIALRLWNAAGALGVKFLPSPNNPFEKMAEDPAFPVDYTQFPRDTLRRKSGECDDLTTFLASLLEGAGVNAAVLDYPGHMALLIDTGSNDPLEIGLPKDQLIEHADTLWIPLEPTMVGSAFDEASRKALFAYREMQEKGKARIIDLRRAWKTYGPATLPAIEAKAEDVDLTENDKRLAAAAGAYLKERYEFLKDDLQKRLSKDAKDTAAITQLGLLNAEHGKLEAASKEFSRVLEISAGDAAALNNLGNIQYVDGKFAEAMARYEKAAEKDPEDPGIWMNALRAAVKAGDKAKADGFAKKAVALSKDLTPDVETLLK